MYRMLICGMCVIALLVSASVLQAEENVQAVIDKAIKALGGKKITQWKAHSWSAKGSINLGGMKQAYEIDYVFQEPDKFRFEMEGNFGGMKLTITAVCDGKNAWEAAGLMVREMEKKKKEEFMHSVYTIYLSQVTPLKNKGFTLTSVGESKVDGKPAIGIKVSKKGKRDVTLYFDKASGLLVKSKTQVWDEFTDKMVTQETYMQDYFQKNGLQLFKKLTIKRDGKVFIVEEFSDHKGMRKADPKLFTKPQPEGN